MTDMLEKVFYGNTLENWGVSLIIIVSALVLNKLIVLLNKHVVQKMMAKRGKKYGVLLSKSLVSPILLGILLLAVWIAAVRLNLDANVDKIIAKCYNILIVLNFTWFIVKLAGSMLDRYAIVKAEKNKANDNKFMPLVKRTVITIIWAIGVVTALKNADQDVAALLAALGVGGIAVALAAQDTVKNIIGGVTLFIDRPFRIGDRVKFDAIDGTVEEIGVRSTRIRTNDKRIITIPNCKIVDASIENITAEPRRRVVVTLNLVSSTSPEKMKEAINILKSIPQTVKDIDNKDITAAFTDLGSSALVLTYIYFIRKSAHDITEASSKVNFEILNKFNQAEIKFA